MSGKNYGVGQFTSIWWNEPKEAGKNGYYSVQIRKTYKDAYGNEQEQKVSFLSSDAIRLAAELQRVATMLLTPREIVRREENIDTATPGDDIPF